MNTKNADARRSPSDQAARHFAQLVLKKVIARANARRQRGG